MAAGAHVPAPSQVRASVATLPPIGQVGGEHCVPASYSWQPPAPLQKPLVAHDTAPWSRHWPEGSRPPAAMGVQVPALPASAHDTHAPVHAVRQQTPWAQTPLEHSLPSPHTAPGGFKPHDPPLHTPGGAQSASARHVELHAETPQLYGKQEVAAGTVQVPAPLQVPAGVNVVVLEGQLAARQGVPCA